jgi:hypothetical protein
MVKTKDFAIKGFKGSAGVKGSADERARSAAIISAVNISILLS